MVFSLVLTSCLKDQEDLFDKPAATRLAEATQQAKETLVNSEYGWVFDYYPDRSLSIGGYTYTVKFDEMQATVGYEYAEGEFQTSYYKVTGTQGPVLSFDTYNDLMHFFATPSATLYQAYDGDFEFVIDEITDDLITMHGTRNGNKVYLRRLTEPANDYLAKVVAIREAVYLSSVTGQVGSAQALGDIDLYDRQMTFTADDGTNVTLPFTFTDQGLRLYEAVKMGGKSVSDFRYNDDALTLRALDEGATDVLLQGSLNSDYLPHCMGLEDDGRSKAYNDGANTINYTVKHLDKLKFSTNTDWLTVTTNGTELTFSMEENNTGHLRSAKLYYTNESGETDSLTISQCEFDRDIRGTYTMYYINYQYEEATATAAINRIGDYTLFSMTVLGTQFRAEVEFDDETATLRLKSGTLLGTYSGYYIYDIFLNETGTYWSAYSKNAVATAPFEYDEEWGTVAEFGGYFGNMEIATIMLMAHTSMDFSAETAAGYIEVLQYPLLVKNTPAHGAKAADQYFRHQVVDEQPLLMSVPNIHKIIDEQ